MSCLNCLQVNNDAFHQKTRFFKSGQPLVVFLLNTVLNSKKICQAYCCCEKATPKCLVCKFWTEFLNNEYDIYENSLDVHFLSFFHEQLVENLKKLKKLDNHIVCKLLNSEFCYVHKDIFSGESFRFSLPDRVDF